jgi:putative membrane protein
MRRALFLTAAAAAALSLAACNKHKDDGANTADTGNAAMAGNAADTGNSSMASANPGQSGPVNKAQDAMGAAVGATSAATLGSHDTGAFVENAGQGNMYEIQAAQIAEQKSKNPDVKAFAKMMVTDHTALANEMKPLITKAGKTPPTTLDQRRQGFLDNLKAAGPADFDKTYIDQQVAAHEETLTLMKGYAQNGDDAGLKAAAAKATPKIQGHLDRAKAIQSKLGGGSGAGQ